MNNFGWDTAFALNSDQVDEAIDLAWTERAQELKERSMELKDE